MSRVDYDYTIQQNVGGMTMSTNQSNHSSGQATSQTIVNSYQDASQSGGMQSLTQDHTTNQMADQAAPSPAMASQATSSQTISAQQAQAQSTQTAQGEKTVIGVFNSRDDAEAAINQLRQQGFTNEEINIVSKKGGRQGGTEYVDDDITDGALTGGTLGGIGGLILGAGALAIPGVGPIIAAGPIAAALSGAVAGGIAGGLIDWGIPAEVSRRYEQEVAQGGILAVVRTNSQKVNQAAQILRQNGAKDVESHSGSSDR
jgi:uncharacterized membrane protein